MYGKTIGVNMSIIAKASVDIHIASVDISITSEGKCGYIQSYLRQMLIFP
jgi:hypothetical protein